MDILDDETSVKLLYKQHPHAYKPTKLIDICKIRATAEGISLGQYLENKTLEDLLSRTNFETVRPHKFGKFALFMNRWFGFNASLMKFWRRMCIGTCLNCGASDKDTILLQYQYVGMFEHYLFVSLANARRQYSKNPMFFSEGALFKCNKCGCQRWIAANR